MNVTRAVLPVMRKQRQGTSLDRLPAAGLSGFEFFFWPCVRRVEIGLEGWMESTCTPRWPPFGIRQKTTSTRGVLRTELPHEQRLELAEPSITDYDGE